MFKDRSRIMTATTSSFTKGIETREDVFGAGVFGAKKDAMIRISRKLSSNSSKIYKGMGKGIVMNRLSLI
jgi:hypothetical protein